MSTYNVENMRFLPATGKVAEKNPDRFGTVYGIFHSEDGKTELSITSKNVSFAEAKNDGTVIDLENGILTIPDGRRGRTASVGATVDELNNALANLRKSK